MEFPPRARSILERMMKSQAYREMAAARLFGHGLQFVPPKWLKLMAWHVSEEAQHYVAVADVHQKFTGHSVHPWVEQRLSSRPVPLSASWLDLAMAQFLYDRAGLWQLREYTQCPYLPYRDAVATILREEQGHQALGENIVLELCQSQSDLEKEIVFQRWLKLALLSFGRPKTEEGLYAVAAGLKKRASEEVMQDFLNDIKPAMRLGELRFPSTESLGLDLSGALDWRV
jgi:1,2-phenylacetyl-CoA epoxidase catalytic subunit